MILLLLEKVEIRGDKRFIELLKDWKTIAPRKVQERIRGVIRAIEDRLEL